MEKPIPNTQCCVGGHAKFFFSNGKSVSGKIIDIPWDGDDDWAIAESEAQCLVIISNFDYVMFTEPKG